MPQLPFATYMHAWSGFRESTNETDAIAAHLINNTDLTEKKKIIDLGCGDGLLARKIVDKCVCDKITLVELEKELLRKAKKNFKSFTDINVGFVNCDLTTLKSEYYRNYDAVIASHLFYLIDENYIHDLLKKLLSGTKLYIVLDTPCSIFANVWKETANFYFKRLIKTHDLITSLNTSNYLVKKTVINCVMQNPLHLPIKKRSAVLSFLCYTEINSLLKEKPHFSVILENECGGEIQINYNAYCYEITRV